MDDSHAAKSENGRPLEPSWMASLRPHCEYYEHINFLSPPPARWLDDGFDRYWMLTRDEVADLRKFRDAGGRKPIEASWGDWIGPVWYGEHPAGLKAKHRLACLLFVAGMQKQHIARHIGMTPSRLNILLSSSACRWRCFWLRKRHRWPEYTLLRRLAKWGIPLETFAKRDWPAFKISFYREAYAAQGKGKTG